MNIRTSFLSCHDPKPVYLAVHRLVALDHKHLLLFLAAIYCSIVFSILINIKMSDQVIDEEKITAVYKYILAEEVPEDDNYQKAMKLLKLGYVE